MAKNTTLITISLPNEMAEKIREIAERENRKISNVIKMAIDEWMKASDASASTKDKIDKGLAWERAVEGKDEKNIDPNRVAELIEKGEKFDEWVESHGDNSMEILKESLSNDE